ncbi:MAG: hypothetical protein ISS13_04540 [Actinobacteria bacterium]|nr:hypothetical protein [Actinomycetota bacterium]
MPDIKKNVLNERGQVAVIAALLIVCLLGMAALVIDVGSIYEERRQTQTVADAAALAGAQDLPEYPGQAIQTAIDYAGLNGVAISEDNIQIFETYVPNDTITVTPTDVDAPLFFAKVLNVNSATVNATATAIAGGALSMTGLMPWTIPVAPYGGELNIISGAIYALKVGAGPLEEPEEEIPLPPGQVQGQFQGMAFDGPGAAEYKDNIIYGCEQDVVIGQWYPTQTGNIAMPTKTKTEERIAGDSHFFYDGEIIGVDENGKFFVKNDNCPRVVYVPIINEMVNPSQDVQIINFAIFFIEEVRWNDPVYGNGATVLGRFVDYMIAVTSGGITGYTEGIKIIRLVK